MLGAHKQNFFFYKLSLVLLVILVILWYMMLVQKVHPCSLCILQQILIYILLFISLIGAIWPAQKNYSAILIKLSIVIFSIIGVIVAARQSWMQFFPEKYIGACQADLAMLYQNIPFMSFVKILIQGTPDCATNTDSLLGVPLPIASLVIFLFDCIS